MGTDPSWENVVPVPARLSKAFYERLGEDVTNELVNWFNSVDATYRGELRDLNESNFARFDAKLGERLTALRSDLDTKWTERWTALDAKIGERLAELDGKWGVRWTELDAKVERSLAKLKGELLAEIARTQSATVRWMFGFWVPTAIGIVATAGGVVALLLRR
jgi:hypothetical protein